MLKVEQNRSNPNFTNFSIKKGGSNVQFCSMKAIFETEQGNWILLRGDQYMGKH